MFFLLGHSCSVSIDKVITEPLLLKTSKSKQLNDDDDHDEPDDGGEASEEIQKPVTSIVAAYKLLTPTVKVEPLGVYGYSYLESNDASFR